VSLLPTVSNSLTNVGNVNYPLRCIHIGVFSAKLNATIAKSVLALAPWDETKSRIATIATIYCLNALGANKSTAFATVAAISPQRLL